MTQNEAYQEIMSITLRVIELGLSISENFPNRLGKSINCSDQDNLSSVLKNVSYQEKYEVINNNKDYNFKLLDGALIQLMYRFNSTGRILESHRLAYFPAPNFKTYEDDPEGYEQFFFGNSEYHDLIEKNIVNIPLRFDYSSDIGKFKEIHHPYSHLHLGEYEKCRIPSISPLTPSRFMNFILRNFYNTALVDYCGNYSFPNLYNFSKSTTSSEENLIHINFH